jgi:hypothetical protein
MSENLNNISHKDKDNKDNISEKKSFHSIKNSFDYTKNTKNDYNPSFVKAFKCYLINKKSK